MKREYPSCPIPAVSAVIFSGDNVLLVRRAHAPSQGQWNLPGGVVELGEPRHEALIREVFEEVGIEIAVKGLVGVFDRIVRDYQGRVRYHYVILDYWAEHIRGTARAGSDAQEVRWVSLDELQALHVGAETVAVIERTWTMRAHNVVEAPLDPVISQG